MRTLLSFGFILISASAFCADDVSFGDWNEMENCAKQEIPKPPESKADFDMSDWSLYMHNFYTIRECKIAIAAREVGRRERTR